MGKKTPIEKITGLPDPIGRALGIGDDTDFTEKKITRGQKVKSPRSLAQEIGRVKTQMQEIAQEELMEWKEMSEPAQDWARQMILPSQYRGTPFEELPENLQEEMTRAGTHYMKEWGEAWT